MVEVEAVGERVPEAPAILGERIEHQEAGRIPLVPRLVVVQFFRRHLLLSAVSCETPSHACTIWSSSALVVPLRLTRTLVDSVCVSAVSLLQTPLGPA